MRSEAVAFMLIVLLIASAGAGYFAGSSTKTTTTTATGPTTTTTQTVTHATTSFETILSTTTSTLTATMVETTTPRSIVGAEVQCGFVAKCNTFNSAGLELSLSVNSTQLKPNGTISLNVTEFNPLPIALNISSSTHWPVSGLWWGCGLYYFPDGVAVYRGYYGLNNLSTASALDFWAPIPCPVEWVGNGTSVGIVGSLQNVTSYSFMANSYKASYTAFYIPNTGPVTLGTFLPVRIVAGTAISATSSNFFPTFGNSLLSTAPAVYTLVAGDEWGDLALLHFSVM
jgi:hypothetical protein